jgi:class 3 adenylate cyclase
MTHTASTQQGTFLTMPAKPANDLLGIDKEVVILLSDMIGYSHLISDMRPVEIRDFMLHYHSNLKSIVESVCGPEQRIESSAGDGALALFERRTGQGKDHICGQALNVALEMVYAMERGVIPATRIGLFTGQIIEAVLDGKTMRFGASFSVASRLEELCGYFGTRILMDREVAFWQTEHAQYLTSIGKVTPKNFHHPVHIFSIYRPGIHHCPADLAKEKLQTFIELKNHAVDVFCGNLLQGILPDFPLARQRLLAAQEIFIEMTGQRDLATERLLEYIGNYPQPENDFTSIGMKIGESTGPNLGVRLLNLSSGLFKAMDAEFYQTLVMNTEWERLFKLTWRKKDERIIAYQDRPDGVYFIDQGSVDVLDEQGQRLNTLGAGDVFGEMAYFTKPGRRSASVVARSDLVLRQISGDDLKNLPTIKKIFRKIAQKRKRTNQQTAE